MFQKGASACEAAAESHCRAESGHDPATTRFRVCECTPLGPTEYALWRPTVLKRIALVWRRREMHARTPYLKPVDHVPPSVVPPAPAWPSWDWSGAPLGVRLPYHCLIRKGSRLVIASRGALGGSTPKYSACLGVQLDDDRIETREATEAGRQRSDRSRPATKLPFAGCWIW